jgi:hypothetical protein
MLIDAGKEVGLEVNTEKTKYMLLSRQQNGGQNQDIKIGNRCFGNVEQFRYLGTTITNQNLIQGESRRLTTLWTSTACYRTALPFLPSNFNIQSMCILNTATVS